MALYKAMLATSGTGALTQPPTSCTSFFNTSCEKIKERKFPYNVRIGELIVQLDFSESFMFL